MSESNPPHDEEMSLADVSDDAVHPVHLVEVEMKDGRREQHALRVGGAPGMTAEQMATHINDHNHFKGHAKKITVKRGGMKAVKGSLRSIIRNPKAATPVVHTIAKVEEHKDENPLFNQENAATAEPEAPIGSVQVAPAEGSDDPSHTSRRVEISGDTVKEVVPPDSEVPVPVGDKRVFPQK